jgi:CBS domain containing-hemolysin-like protein
MIPRNEIVAMDVQEGIAKLHNLFIQSGHSNIILYRENIDNVVGYCSSSAVFRHPETVTEILTPIITIPETTPASELLTRFIEERKKIAVVMDEFGGTAGLVSMEDVIEEIFGDIEDEYDVDEFTEHAIDANTFLFSGRLEIDYLNETYSLNLPQGDYDTLGGLILSLTEDLPKSGEIVTLPNFILTIQSTVKNRIGIVRLTRQEPPSETEENLDKNS